MGHGLTPIKEEICDLQLPICDWKRPIAEANCKLQLANSNIDFLLVSICVPSVANHSCWLAEMLLSEVRKLSGKTQRGVARQLGIKQPSLSKLESQDDMQISTLKKIVAAMGGEVRITARFPAGEVRIKQFDEKRKALKKLREIRLV